MIKKISTVCAATILLGLAATAAANNPFKVTFSTFSLNPNLEQMHALNLGLKAELQYSFSQHWYIKGDIRSYAHGKIGFGTKVGYQYQINKFTPYAEFGYDENPDVKKFFDQITYDVGLKYKLSKHFQPFIEFDKFLTHKQQSAKIGASFPINDRYSLAADYIHSLCKHGDGFELKFSMAF